jgi:ATP-binding cassette subfamily B protein
MIVDHQVVALVGPSGGGKSTVAALLMGLYPPEEGAVRIDGVGVDQLDKRWLRWHVGTVSQATALIAGTVRDNIMYGTTGATHQVRLVLLLLVAPLVS